QTTGVDSTVGKSTNVGPFAYLRPNSHIGNDVKIGDFVEIKNSTIDDGTKVAHLTYVGDAEVGKNVNFGCGTVIVNYDGNKKHRTIIEDNCFIGCNTNLVSPVVIKKGAYTAAGSTITDEVPADSLAIARSRQVVKIDWTKKR
ncbi:MAG: DapH/DapD/GlmU-related protein, partial [Oscillospiraceae bacterium]